MTRFEVGKIYFCRSACDHTCVWTFEVVARSDKFVTLRDPDVPHGKTKRVGVRCWEGIETCSPLGRYSLSPVLFADRPVEDAA